MEFPLTLQSEYSVWVETGSTFMTTSGRDSGSVGMLSESTDAAGRVGPLNSPATIILVFGTRREAFFFSEEPDFLFMGLGFSADVAAGSRAGTI